MPRYVVPVAGVIVTSGGLDTSTAILVGDPATAWSDDSDATYARVGVAETVSFYGWAEGTSVATPDLPYMNAETTQVFVEARVSGTGLSRAVRLEVASTLQAYADDPAASWPGAAGWLTYPVTDWFDGATPEKLAQYCREGRLTAEIRPPAVAGYHYIYEVRFVFDTGRRLHPCRQFPRADGLAASSARRHYPRDESWQAGPRWRGGYY